MSNDLNILWHAGEPLVAGLEFYKNAFEIIRKNNIHTKKITHSIQTNGTLINDSWCKLFGNYDVDIGISIDGPKFLNDKVRLGWNGAGSYDKTMAGVEKLKEHNIPYSAICVLTEDSLNFPNELFDFFIENGFQSIAFNLEEIEATNTQSSLLNNNQDIKEKYASFLKEVLDKWLLAKGSIQIREFNTTIRKIINAKRSQTYVPMLDVSQGLQVLTIRTDGKVIAFSPELATGTKSNIDEFVIGDINDLEFLEDLVANATYREIRSEISKGISKCQKECAYFRVCGGGWPSNKYAENGTFNSTETKICKLHTQVLTDVLIENLIARKEFSDTI